LTGQVVERDETAQHQKLSAALPENRANPLIGAGPGIKTEVERAVDVSPRNIRVANSAAPDVKMPPITIPSRLQRQVVKLRREVESCHSERTIDPQSEHGCANGKRARTSKTAWPTM